MRNHEERMEEIRRRSNVLMQERKKKRKTILTICVPLALSLVVLGVWLLPKNSPTESIPWEDDGILPEAVMEETLNRTEAMTLPAMQTEEGMSLESHSPVTETTSALQSYSAYPGVSIEILRVERNEEGTSLCIRWKNETDQMVLFGAGFYIDIWQDSRWQPCEMKENTAFPAIAYILEPGQEREETYALTWVYELPEEGTCRFRTECFRDETGAGNKPYELWASFSPDKP